MINSKLSPLDLLKNMIDVEDYALNVFITLCIFLTLPVTVAIEEMSFFKLKLIKTYLCSMTS